MGAAWLICSFQSVRRTENPAVIGVEGAPSWRYWSVSVLAVLSCSVSPKRAVMRFVP